MSPGLNARGSQVADAVSSPVKITLSRAMPVAQPGCPMDHIQASANRSPGDLWLRCIGTIFHQSFVYLAVPGRLFAAVSNENS